VTLPVVLRDEAQAEFDEAFDWYEGQRAGLGVDFAARVQDVFDRISANPAIHAVVFADVRKAVVARFPYCVFYRADATRVEVIAVFHTRRDPSIWQSRSTN
jgi:plasmid stabilization system protein ParE